MKRTHARRLSLTLAIAVTLLAAVAGFAQQTRMAPAPSQEELMAIEQTKADPEIAVMETNKGTIKIGFFPDVAPNHVARFKELANEGFYDGVLFHRVIPDFMIQAGDPQTKDPDCDRRIMGTGGSDKPNVRSEFNDRPHLRGTLSAARSQSPHSANSQFFLCHGAPTWLNGQYTVYGHVIEGMEVVDKIATVERDQRDNPIEPVRIESVTIVNREE